MEDKNTILDALTDEDVEYISNLHLAEDEIASLINLLELIQSDNKDRAINIIKTLFDNKTLINLEPTEAENVTEEDTEVTDNSETTNVIDETTDNIDDTDDIEEKETDTEIVDESCVPVSERYTRILLGEH
nr:hypothetical protein YSBCXYJI_YSBCXYJI_CDS_0003 [Caudoviricetes sp.]